MQQNVRDIDINDRTYCDSRRYRLPRSLSEPGYFSTSRLLCLQLRGPKKCNVTKSPSQTANMLKHQSERGNVQ